MHLSVAGQLRGHSGDHDRGRVIKGVRGHPVPAAWVGDLMELYWLMGMRGPRALWPSISHLVHKRDLGNAQGDFPERTALSTDQVTFVLECSDAFYQQQYLQLLGRPKVLCPCPAPAANYASMMLDVIVLTVPISAAAWSRSLQPCDTHKLVRGCSLEVFLAIMSAELGVLRSVCLASSEGHVLLLIAGAARGIHPC